MADVTIKTKRVFYKGYTITRNDGCQYLAEGQANGEWKLMALDAAGDLFGYKEWVATCDSLKDCKLLARYCE